MMRNLIHIKEPGPRHHVMRCCMGHQPPDPIQSDYLAPLPLLSNLMITMLALTSDVSKTGAQSTRS